MSSKKTGKKKNLPSSTSEMSKEMLKEILSKKMKCNTRALQIVEKLCENTIDETWFLGCLADINQSHFEDVITERAILKLCGYPLCSKKLENVPNKKYHISTRYNKVFDITERKNFCSDICYKAGMYVKNQMLTSPLWFRDQENIPEFKLLPCSAQASMGEEVVFLPDKEQLKKDILSDNNMEDKVEMLKTKIDDLNLKDENERKHSITEAKKPVLENHPEDEKEDLCEKLQGNVNVHQTEGRVGGAVLETKAQVQKEVLDPVKKVEKCVYEWFTLDTVLYLYGKERVSELMKDREEELKEVLKRKPMVFGKNEKIDRMVGLYSMLDQQLFDSEPPEKNLKPLPDYSAIKEDGKKLEVKVRAFYKGQLEVESVSEPDCKDKDDPDKSEVYLPIVDAHAQNVLRRKILLDRLNRVLPELIRTFTTARCFEVSELRDLIGHLTLSAHNITFKPSEWYLAGFIVIKLLSLRNKQLDSLLKSDTGRRHVTLFLMNYDLPQNYLDNIVEWLISPDELIEKLK